MSQSTSKSPSKRKVPALIDGSAARELLIEEQQESHQVKRAKTIGLDVVSGRSDVPLLDLFFDAFLSLEEFTLVASTFSSSDLRWDPLLNAVDWTRPEYPLFLERLQVFLEIHGGCPADKAIHLLSKWSSLTLPTEWAGYVDLLELLLTFVHRPTQLLKAVRQVRDDVECRNQRFFNLLIHHLRTVGRSDLAEAEESQVQGVWSSEGDMQEADRLDAEREEGEEEEEEEEKAEAEVSSGDELDAESSSDSDSSVEDAPFAFDPKQDVHEWLAERTESSPDDSHRCPAGEARKDYEQWVEQSAFSRQRVSKQVFAKYVEKFHPKTTDNGHRFFTGLLLKAAFRDSSKLNFSVRQ